MDSHKEKFRCPVCGFIGLESRPYENMPEKIDRNGAAPPYCLLWGQPSYEVCDCCGFEFGFDDEPGGSAQPVSFAEYLTVWIHDGCLWFTPEKRPTNWSLTDQLAKADITP